MLIAQALALSPFNKFGIIHEHGQAHGVASSAARKLYMLTMTMFWCHVMRHERFK